MPSYDALPVRQRGSIQPAVVPIATEEWAGRLGPEMVAFWMYPWLWASMAAEEMEHKIGSRTWSRTLPARVLAGQHLEGAVGVTSHTGGTRSSSGDLKGEGSWIYWARGYHTSH